MKRTIVHTSNLINAGTLLCTKRIHYYFRMACRNSLSGCRLEMDDARCQSIKVNRKFPFYIFIHKKKQIFCHYNLSTLILKNSPTPPKKTAMQIIQHAQVQQQRHNKFHNEIIVSFYDGIVSCQLNILRLHTWWLCQEFSIGMLLIFHHHRHHTFPRIASTIVVHIMVMHKIGWHKIQI